MHVKARSTKNHNQAFALAVYVVCEINTCKRILSYLWFVFKGQITCLFQCIVGNPLFFLLTIGKLPEIYSVSEIF